MKKTWGTLLKSHILLMDDENEIRDVTMEMLTALGHDVEVFGNGEAALEAYRSAFNSKRSFSFVILDLTIKGGMGGARTIRKLREIDPDVKAILSSGYGEAEAVANWKEMGFKAVSPKPYKLELLSEVIRSVLGLTPEANWQNLSL
jgi:DNA-binding NtrC family response regulator